MRLQRVAILHISFEERVVGVIGQPQILLSLLRILANKVLLGIVMAKTDSSKTSHLPPASAYFPPSLRAPKRDAELALKTINSARCDSPGRQQQYHRLHHSPRHTLRSEKSQMPFQPLDLRKLNQRVDKYKLLSVTILHRTVRVRQSRTFR